MMNDELQRKRKPDFSIENPLPFPPRAKRISSHPPNSSFIILHSSFLQKRIFKPN